MNTNSRIAAYGCVLMINIVTPTALNINDILFLFLTQNNC